MKEKEFHYLMEMLVNGNISDFKESIENMLEEEMGQFVEFCNHDEVYTRTFVIRAMGHALNACKKDFEPEKPEKWEFYERILLEKVPTDCPECGVDWEFWCTTEKLEDGTVILYCGGCGHSYEYKEEK